MSRPARQSSVTPRARTRGRRGGHPNDRRRLAGPAGRVLSGAVWPPLVGAIDRVAALATGRRYPSYFRRFRRMEGWTRERLEAWRWRRLRALLEHAYETTPFWREQFDRLGAKPADLAAPAGFRSIPPLDKATINARRDDLTSRRPGRGVRERSTGGSTGHNVWFRLDRETQDRRRAAGRLTEEWDGVRPGTRIAFLWGAALDAEPSVASRVADLLSNRLFLSVYGVGEERLAEHWRRLERFRPEVITSYPSILHHLARRMGREACRRLGVRLIYSSAEVLQDPVRADLEDLFGAAVRDRYASREFGMIAAECPEGGGLHVMDMRLYLELEPGPAPGEPSPILVTDLDNRTMPMIRYRIDDLALPAPGPCACGRPFGLLSRIEGRALDVVVTPDGRAFGGTFFTLQLRPFDRTIERFQVVQDRPDHLVVRVVPGPGYGPAVRQRVLDTLAGALGRTVSVELLEVPEIPPSPSGKHRFVISQVGGGRSG
ncbi:MAG: phenylacetate--CoA ligase family protein [Acidobacteria bacterium]|nr:MAG: phenylacetate--CoA ligase family protein [Acidobacteriota bacterium]